MFNLTKSVITGNYLTRRAMFERYLKEEELAQPGSRVRHYLYLAAIGAIAVATLAVNWIVRH